MTHNEISREIISASIAVHSALGPGLLESAYQACLVFELHSRGIHVDSEVALPVVYREVKLDCGYRIDLVVKRLVVVELKAVDALTKLHEAQLISYLKLSKLKLRLLINFHVPNKGTALDPQRAAALTTESAPVGRLSKHARTARS